MTHNSWIIGTGGDEDAASAADDAADGGGGGGDGVGRGGVGGGGGGGATSPSLVYCPCNVVVVGTVSNRRSAMRTGCVGDIKDDLLDCFFSMLHPHDVFDLAGGWSGGLSAAPTPTTAAGATSRALVGRRRRRWWRRQRRRQW
jgi:hypothetical protein